MTSPFPSLVRENRNPVLDEIDGLSHPAKSALVSAHSQVLGSTQPFPSLMGSTASPAPEATFAPAPLAMPSSIPMPSLSPPMPQAGPQSMPGRSSPPLTLRAPGPAIPALSDSAVPKPPLSSHQAEYARLTQPTLPGTEHTKNDTGVSGVQQIHNPWLRGFATAGDAVLTGFLPGVAAAVPGTSLHHQVLVNQASRAVGQDDETAKNAAEVGNLQATMEHTRADTAHTQVETNAIEHPSGDIKDEDLLYDKQGNPIGYRDRKGVYYGADDPNLPPGVKAVIGAAHAPVKEPHYTTMPDGSIVSIQTDPKSGKPQAEVVYKGDPKVETELAKLQVNGKPHSVIVNKRTGETVKDLGESGEKPTTVNVNAGAAALDRESGRFAKSWEKAAADANAQLDKISDARAMINGTAESQALGVPKVLTALVSGAGSGVRITQAELNQIARARGISGDIEGFFNKVSGKGALTSEQQKQLTGLLDDVKQRILHKQQIANEALDNINGGRSRDEIIQHDSTARKKLSALERGEDQGSSAASGHVIQINGKNYQYKGSGATDDMKNYTEVR